MPNDTPRVLIVEDEDDFHYLYRLALEPEGFEVEAVHDADEAMDAIRERPPDFILADTVGAEGKGPALLARLKSDTALRDIPVVVCSGRAETADSRRALDAGAVAYFIKPVDTAELIRTIRKLLG